jgi:hypothetical protein
MQGLSFPLEQFSILNFNFKIAHKIISHRHGTHPKSSRAIKPPIIATYPGIISIAQRQGSLAGKTGARHVPPGALHGFSSDIIISPKIIFVT